MGEGPFGGECTGVVARSSQQDWWQRTRSLPAISGESVKGGYSQGYREYSPAGEAIGAALPRSEIRPRHHRALPYAEVAGAITTVRGSGAFPPWCWRSSSSS